MRWIDALRCRFSAPILREGEIAPETVGVAADGRALPIDGRWSVMFIFGRLNPTHEAYLHALAAEAFPDDCDVFGVCASAPRRSSPIPIVVDVDGTIAHQFGATSPLGVPPTVFVINPKRRVRLANRGHPSPPAILRSIQALKLATRARQ